MKNLLVVLTIALFTSISFAQKPRAEHSLALFDGYPLCQALFQNWVQTSLGTVEEAVGDSPEALRVFEELQALHFKPGRQPHLESVPKRLREHPRHRTYSGGCFVSDTPVLFLDSNEAEEVTIYDIDPGDFVLGSLAAVTTDPNYQGPCWARVLSLIVGLVTHEDQLQTVTYKNHSGNEFHLKSTSNHRFFSQEGGYTWEWTRARDLHNWSTLSECQGGVCTVISSTGEPAAAKPTNWFQRNLGSGFSKLVYNLKTDVSTYYVGDEEGRVLVHNLK